MSKNFVRKVGASVLGVLMVANFGEVGNVFGATMAKVLINELAWAGSVDSTNDEWIELYNPSSVAVDLTGWVIKDDGSTSYVLSGQIAPKGYFLIEKHEGAVSDVVADLIVGNMSLANTGDSLELFDQSGKLVDVVNGSGGSWYAGDAGASKATMERKEILGGDVKSNFGSSSGKIGVASAGGVITGTPRVQNSLFVDPDLVLPNSLWIQKEVSEVKVGDVVEVKLALKEVGEVLSYGIRVKYDSAVFELIEVSKGAFLSENGGVATSFNYGFDDGVKGELLIAEARTIQDPVGISGSGVLANLKFKVLSTDSGLGINFGDGTFVAGLSGDLNVGVKGVNFIKFDEGSAEEIAGLESLVAVPGSSRYQIKLSWVKGQGVADKYLVQRMSAKGDWVSIGEVVGNEFVDMDGVVGGGGIVPMVNYKYRVAAKVLNDVGGFVEVTGVENRGLKGDNNRSDLVDGRDLESLAKRFGKEFGDVGYDALVDTDYNGVISGGDLIDIGANFAKRYK